MVLFSLRPSGAFIAVGFGQACVLHREAKPKAHQPNEKPREMKNEKRPVLTMFSPNNYELVASLELHHASSQLLCLSYCSFCSNTPFRHTSYSLRTDLFWAA
jgi:hypothetical protein